MLSIAKTLSLAILLALNIFPDKLFFPIVLGSGFAHFWLGLYFSKNQMAERARNLQVKVAAVASIAIIIGLLTLDLPWLNRLAFAMHFGISEMTIGIFERKLKVSKKTLLLRLLAEFGICTLCFFKDSAFAQYREMGLSLIGVVGIGYVYFLFQEIGGRERSKFYDLMASQIINVFFAWILIYKLAVDESRALMLTILLHGTFWVVYPLYRVDFKLDMQSLRQFSVSFFLTILTTVGGVAISFTFPGGFQFVRFNYLIWFYVHLFSILILHIPGRWQKMRI